MRVTLPRAMNVVLQSSDSVYDVIDEETSETVRSIMLKKHPEERPVLLDAIVPQPSNDGSPHPVVLDKITTQCIRRIAMTSEGAACPQGQMLMTDNNVAHPLLGPLMNYVKPWPEWHEGYVPVLLVLLVFHASWPHSSFLIAHPFNCSFLYVCWYVVCT